MRDPEEDALQEQWAELAVQITRIDAQLGAVKRDLRDEMPRSQFHEMKTLKAELAAKKKDLERKILPINIKLKAARIRHFESIRSFTPEALADGVRAWMDDEQHEPSAQEVEAMSRAVRAVLRHRRETREQTERAARDAIAADLG